MTAFAGGYGSGLDGLARLAVQALGADAALIALTGGGGRDGALTLAASAGVCAGDASALMEACRAVRDGAAGASPAAPSPHGDAAVLAVPLLTPEGETVGWFCVRRSGPKGVAPAGSLLPALAGLAANEVAHQRRDAGLQEALQRAARNERMLHLVAEARSIAGALANILKELCSRHHALIGRMWRMTAPGDLLEELSRYNADDLAADSYYRQPPASPMMWGNSFTADAIRCNEPRVMMYAEIRNPERYVLLHTAIRAGLKCQISYPIWVQDERFGVSLAFNTVRTDLPEVVADIASLANTIRPALLRKVAEDRIRFMALHDDLTGLANRLRFGEVLAQALKAAKEGGRGLALLYLDLDRFKLVNDMRGHAVGDKLLAAVAGRLCATVRKEDTVARMGGDEFAILQADTNQPGAALGLAARVVEALALPFDIGGHRLMIGCSVGIALHPGDGDTPDLLLRNADTALYCVKGTGRDGFCLFDPGMNARLRERAQLEADMAEALAQSGFTLAYQPLCSADSLRVVGFEALLRWTHPVRGPIPPERFIPSAEATGLIVPLGEWALEAACRDAAGWDPPVRLAVNLSPLQFRQPDLPRRVAGILACTGLAPGRLDLEVTEGLLLDDAALVLDNMAALRSQGIGITLDDFGTAYASLSYLRRFPFDRIKIDKSFIEGITRDGDTLAIVEAVLALSARLGLSVVAEGVETPEQLNVLRSLGCRLVQGFLTGRPMTGAAALDRLARQDAAPHGAVRTRADPH